MIQIAFQCNRNTEHIMAHLNKTFYSVLNEEALSWFWLEIERHAFREPELFHTL